MRLNVHIKFLINMDDSLVDKIAHSCLELYKKLPKTGKPVEHEWTVLSCIVQYESDQDKYLVVSLGTGTKCIGAGKLSGAGNVVNDSHAEVIARRGFLVYLYENIENTLKNNDSIFIFQDGKFKLKPGIEFIFYSSQIPCGDASIIPKTIDEEYGEVIRSRKRHADEDICDVDDKTTKCLEVDDVHRTGAKCLPTAEQDPKMSGIRYHVVGQVRTKPGRGDVTLSVSCSDKLARWIHVGVQGGLLDMLLAEPIYIKYFIFGAEEPYSKEALERALLKRNNDGIMTDVVPTFHQCSVVFPNKKSEVNVRPAPSNIIWIRTSDDNGILEFASQGVKLGLIKKRYNLVSSYLCISKYKLYQRFQKILMLSEELKLSICQDNLESTPYNEMKNKSERYIRNWNNVKDNFFHIWTEKPNIWNFCINSV